MSFINSLGICSYYCVLLVLLLLPRAVCQLQFSSPYNGNKVIGVLGSSVNFTWAFSGGNVDRFHWGTKQDGVHSIKDVLVSIDKFMTVTTIQTLPYSGRVSGVWDGSSPGQVTFTLSPIKKEDERFYICKLVPDSLGASLVYDTVQLLVAEAPQIGLPSVQASYNEGSSVNISCTASGTPEPDVKWIRNGKVKSSWKNAAFLTFSSINRADNGRYTCKATSSAGNDEKHVTLVIHYKPEGTTITTSAAANTVTQGDIVTFTCHVTAAKPQVSQYRFYLNGTTPVKDSNDGQFTINNVQRSQHYGEYKCVPHNDVGDGPEATVTLHVNVPVQFTVLPQNVTVNETNPIVVSCAASGFPTPSISWKKYVQGTAVSQDSNTQRSKRSDAGMYVCTASNGVGQHKTAKVYVTVQYPPTIKEATASSAKSWIGQTVTLKCVSDGVPTPTLTWYKPDGNKLNTVTATQNTVNVKMEGDQDFGGYKCDADNGITPADFKIVKIEQIRVPAPMTIDNLPSEVTDDTITLKWSKPKNNGRVFTQYTVYQRIVTDGKPGEWTEIKIITKVSARELKVELEKGRVYEFLVTATNEFGESLKEDRKIKRVKASGVPAAVQMGDIPSEVTDSTITLKWKEPQSYGRKIIEYTVYQRIVTDGRPGEWTKLRTITDTSVRELKVELEKGRKYEFVVTATNVHGESKIEESKIQRVKASGSCADLTSHCHHWIASCPLNHLKTHWCRKTCGDC